MALMFEPLRKYAVFEGRARRAEYWQFALFVWVLDMVMLAALGSIAGSSTMGGEPAAMAGPGLVGYGLFCLLTLGLLVPSIAVTIRRLHDTNRSGWWLLLAFIPFLGALALLVFTLLDGTPGPNRFGEDPKNRVAMGMATAA